MCHDAHPFADYLLVEHYLMLLYYCSFSRQLVLDIVKAGSNAVSIPIFVKIRLLDTIDETTKLCHQLREAGASLIAIHARCECTLSLSHFHNASFVNSFISILQTGQLGREQALALEMDLLSLIKWHK